MIESTYVVVDEHTLGYTIPTLPNYVGILNSSVLRGAGSEQARGVHLWTDGKTVRPATREDFTTFRVDVGSRSV